MKTKLILDVNKAQHAQLNSIVTGRVGDKVSNVADVYLIDGGTPYNLTGSKAFFECVKPDNTVVRDDNGVKMIDTAKGHFEYTFMAETFGAVGKAKQAFFSIEKDKTVRATTQDFVLITLPDATTNRVPSESYISDLEKLIKELNEMALEEVNSQAAAEASAAKDFANQANELSNNIQMQLNEIVINGDSSVEAAQARVDVEGNIYPSLKPRIDAEQVRITNISRAVTEISINVKTLGVKGDGITDDTTAIENAFRDHPYKIMYFPDGNYRVTRPIRISADNSLELSKNARIYADAAIDYIFDFNTSRPINSIYDLSKGCFITGGTLDGNGKANHILRLNKFLHFSLEGVEFKNGLRRGLVINNTGAMSAELLARNIHFINTIKTNISDNKAIENLGTDNKFENIWTVDWTVGIYDKGNAEVDSFHYWISHKERVPESIAFEVDSSTNIVQSFADTARTTLKVLSGNPRMISSKVYYNTSVYDASLAANYQAKIIDAVPYSTVSVLACRIIGNLSTPPSFVDTITININSLNNLFEGTVSNAFSANWSATRTTGFFLYSGNNEKGIIGTTPSKIFLKNSVSGKQIDLNDDGSLMYSGVNLLGTSGTFTPTVVGSSIAGNPNYTNQRGRYYRNGNIVNCNIIISGTFDGTIGGGLLIKGLPFEMSADNVSGVNFGYIRGLKSPIGYVNIGVSKDITIRTLDANGNAASIDTTTLRNTQFEYHMSFSYPV
ncbi:BppU family phage baseplate upper protein [Bacillus toyonensis]|uniref:BppU family phage baseplate upper protein n=1 Tax=Bacillus toyonensis TaxID=155322 RepID=UPI0015D4C634|nr:BppU family phage baseplate upper protein [Bacillus toyonensis]